MPRRRALPCRLQRLKPRRRTLSLRWHARWACSYSRHRRSGSDGRCRVVRQIGASHHLCAPCSCICVVRAQLPQHVQKSCSECTDTQLSICLFIRCRSGQGSWSGSRVSASRSRTLSRHARRRSPASTSNGHTLTPGSWLRLLAASRTREEPLSRSGPTRRLRRSLLSCPKSPILIRRAFNIPRLAPPRPHAATSTGRHALSRTAIC